MKAMFQGIRTAMERFQYMPRASEFVLQFTYSLTGGVGTCHLMPKDDITRGIHMRIFAARVHKSSVPIAMLTYKEFCNFTACT
jgi:hypothetical protein